MPDIAAKLMATKAIDDKGNKYDAVLVLTSQHTDDAPKWTLRIEGTGSSWFMSTLLEGVLKHGGLRQKLAIDLGAGWFIVNMDKVLREAIDRV